MVLKAVKLTPLSTNVPPPQLGGGIPKIVGGPKWRDKLSKELD